MIIVTGIAEIAPEDAEPVRNAARGMAVASREEPGCSAYAFYEDIEKPGRFRIYEEWQTAEALREHFKTDHMQAFNTVLGSVELRKLEISQFERGVDIKVNG